MSEEQNVNLYRLIRALPHLPTEETKYFRTHFKIIDSA